MLSRIAPSSSSPPLLHAAPQQVPPQPPTTAGERYRDANCNERRSLRTSVPHPVKLNAQSALAAVDEHMPVDARPF
eukprot:1587494-Pleurochrysis_carterae.AAC.1